MTPEPISIPVEPEALPEEAGAAAADRAQAMRDSIPGVHKRGDLEPSSESTTGEPTTERVANADAADRAGAESPSQQILLPAGGGAKRPEPKTTDTKKSSDKGKSAGSGLPFSALTLAGIVAGVLVVLFIAVKLFRRRSLPQNLDVTTFADAFDEDEGAAPETQAHDRFSSAGPAREDSATERSEPKRPEPQVEEWNTAAYSLSEVAANRTEPETGLYNEDSEGEKPMDMDTTDLPTDREDFRAPPMPMMGSGDSELSQLVQELAGRVAALEARLDEANDSRERLERQVAAQSEELRVQRAAIARTQRALRSLSRSEEEQATEPALREPSQPAK